MVRGARSVKEDPARGAHFFVRATLSGFSFERVHFETLAAARRAAQPRFFSSAINAGTAVNRSATRP